MKKTVTITDIARKLGLNVSTVSRALNGSDKVSDKTRKRVQKTAREMNYRPNAVASRLRRGRGYTVGMIVPRINRQFFANVIHGVETVLNPAGYRILICQSDETLEKETEMANALLESQVDGVILSVSKETRRGVHLQAIVDHGIPLIQFDRIIGDLATHEVLNDNFKGAYDLTRHLIDQGYKRILHLGGPQYINIYKDRFLACQKALTDAGLPFYEENLLEDVLTEEKGYEAIKKRFLEKSKPDAIFAASDFSALGALFALKELKINVPREVGLAGFANEPFTRLTAPAITSVDQHSEAIGKAAARMLLETLEDQQERPDGNSAVLKQMMIKPSLMIRESSNRNFDDTRR